jgi:hypothetical protein
MKYSVTTFKSRAYEDLELKLEEQKRDNGRLYAELQLIQSRLLRAENTIAGMLLGTVAITRNSGPASTARLYDDAEPAVAGPSGTRRTPATSRTQATSRTPAPAPGPSVVKWSITQGRNPAGEIKTIWAPRETPALRNV